ncbi:MAG TPA: response regulator [Holophagaceae bacterium]|nr:response regulator [Holophagaceae bacterium]
MHIILLVEDDAVQMRYLRSIFESCRGDFIVLPASDGREALAVLEMTPVDLIVTDLRMPEMDGYGLLGVLSRSQADTPIIVTSTERPRTLEYLEGSFRVLHYVSKPCDPAQVLEIARTELGHSTVGRFEGVSLTSLVQMLALEQKTCTIRAFARNKVGLLMLDHGRLINARFQDTHGLEAAHVVLGWEGALLEVDARLHDPEALIDRPLDQLLLEAAHRRQVANA